MTVKELRKKLEGCNENTKLVIVEGCDSFYDVMVENSVEEVCNISVTKETIYLIIDGC